MNNNQNIKILYGIGGIIIGILFVSGLTPPFCYDGDGKMNWGKNLAPIQRTGGGVTIDQHFIEQMIPHHDGAIAMANLAQTKAARPEIKTLAGAILEAQTKENQEMRSWYTDWFGRSVPEQGSTFSGGMMSQGGMHMGSIQNIDALKNAPDFDKEFIEQMIPHHQMAIMMARMLESGTDKPEMQQLAKSIIESQSKEIQQMQGWYQEWYR